MRKGNGRFLYMSMLTCIFVFCVNSHLSAQEKVNISAGFGYPELINVRATYQLKQTQIGLGVGSIPTANENLLSISGDVSYHFAGKSELSERRPWYVRTGFNFLCDDRLSVVDKFLYYNVRIGRDFNVSNKLGIGIDAGAIFQLFRKTIRDDDSSGWNINFDFPVSPSFSVGVYYRI